MLKKIVVVGLIIVAITVGVLYLIPWGEYESQIEKSEVVEVVEKDSIGQLIPTLSLIDGLYEIESGEGIAAELLFDVEGLKKTKGAFEDFKISFDIAEDYTASKLSVTINAASINTRNGMRDEHLMEADFFHVEKYPTIQFNSTAIVKTDTAYLAKGELELLENKNAIDVPFKHLGAGQNADGKTFEAFEGSFSFDRTAFGMEEVSGAGNVVSILFYCELLKVERE
jgi:polyisoprenoid-binding protein YceI